jgi:hypothetical protein
LKLAGSLQKNKGLRLVTEAGQRAYTQSHRPDLMAQRLFEQFTGEPNVLAPGSESRPKPVRDDQRAAP